MFTFVLPFPLFILVIPPVIAAAVVVAVVHLGLLLLLLLVCPTGRFDTTSVLVVVLPLGLLLRFFAVLPVVFSSGSFIPPSPVVVLMAMVAPDQSGVDRSSLITRSDEVLGRLDHIGRHFWIIGQQHNRTVIEKV